MKLLCTGGSGSLGKTITEKLQRIDRLVVYSRSESRQAAMREDIPEGGATGVRYILGDIRNFDKLDSAMHGITHVIHSAALKRIDTCEYEPLEAVSTNIIGSQNVIRACIKNNVEHCILVSTDKACMPISLYGATKMTAERLFISANNLGKTRFNVVRYGNVLASTGSIIKIWEKQLAEKKPVTVTCKDMTRFFWSLDEAAKFVINRIQDISSERGVIYIPKMEAFDIEKMAEKYSKYGVEYTGLRCPEKVSEDLISTHEGIFTCAYKDYYKIFPEHHEWSKEMEKSTGERMPEGFHLSST